MLLPVDSGRLMTIATGVVDLAREWDDNGSGGRRPSDRQARDEATGMPLWQVEVLYQHTSYGRVSSVTAMVQVPAESQPAVTALTPIQFDGLQVEVRLNKAKGLVEYWSAAGLAGALAVAGRGRARAEGEGS